MDRAEYVTSGRDDKYLSWEATGWISGEHQRLVLQPRLDALWSFNRLGELGMGPGLASLSASLRLRYELTREFAPYLGISWNTMTGSTRDMARDNGDPRDTTRVFMGVRFWF